VEDADVRELGRESVGEGAGAVRGGVVDDEHAPLVREHLAEHAQHRLKVLALVVGGEADDCSHESARMPVR
jgi:hypothetical protein